MPDLLDLSNQALVYKSRKVRETNMEEVKLLLFFDYPQDISHEHQNILNQMRTSMKKMITMMIIAGAWS